MSNDVIILAIVKPQIGCEWLTWPKYKIPALLCLYLWYISLAGMVTFFIHLTRHWETKYVTWPVLLFISETIIHCQPFRPEPCKGQQDNCLSITIYIGYMASRHPLLNFCLIQWNIHNRSRDPCYRWNCYGLYCGQVWRRFGESLKRYGCFQIWCKLGFEPCLNMLERQKPTQRKRCFFLKVYLIFRLAKPAFFRYRHKKRSTERTWKRGSPNLSRDLP